MGVLQLGSRPPNLVDLETVARLGGFSMRRSTKRISGAAAALAVAAALALCGPAAYAAPAAPGDAQAPAAGAQPADGGPAVDWLH